MQYYFPLTKQQVSRFCGYRSRTLLPFHKLRDAAVKFWSCVNSGPNCRVSTLYVASRTSARISNATRMEQQRDCTSVVAIYTFKTCNIYPCLYQLPNFIFNALSSGIRAENPKPRKIRETSVPVYIHGYTWREVTSVCMNSECSRQHTMERPALFLLFSAFLCT